MSRQASDASNASKGLSPEMNKIVSLKLSEDGYLKQEGTDVKVEVRARDRIHDDSDN